MLSRRARSGSGCWLAGVRLRARRPTSLYILPPVRQQRDAEARSTELEVDQEGGSAYAQGVERDHAVNVRADWRVPGWSRARRDSCAVVDELCPTRAHVLGEALTCRLVLVSAVE